MFLIFYINRDHKIIVSQQCKIKTTATAFIQYNQIKFLNVTKTK